MNWLYTWYNPHVDPDAATLAREMSDLFLQGIRGAAAASRKPQLGDNGVANTASGEAPRKNTLSRNRRSAPARNKTRK